MPPAIDFEKIAAQIHHYYSARWPNPELPAEYDKLAETMKEDNRAAARRISEVLAMAGLCLVPNEGQPWTREEQDEILGIINENLELLAEAEHDGWLAARLRQGWKLGPEKSISLREHYLLAPYPEFEKRVLIMLMHQWEKAKLEKRMDQEQAEATKPNAADIRAEVEKQRDKDRDSVRNYVEIIRGTDYRIVWEQNAEDVC